MSIEKPLFKGTLISFAPIDHEKDPEILARWTNDPGFMRLYSVEPVRPQSVWAIKKKLEEVEKNLDEQRNGFYFHIHTREDDRLVGIAELKWISWSNGIGFVNLSIGSAQDWRKGYGSEALLMLIRYAFRELNLHRLTAIIPAYNAAALVLFAKHGFVEEVRRRKALHRDGKRWDLLHLGLLAEEWKEAGK